MKKSTLLSMMALCALSSALVRADERAIKPLFETRFPGVKVESVVKEPLSGLYEVYVGGQIYYTDPSVNYVIQGNLINAKTRQSLTSERLKKLSEIPFDKLPSEQAIKVVNGNGQRQLAVFEDPDCPFCKQLESELLKVNNITIYVFLYPLEQLHPGATVKAQKIWCSPDRAKAWLSAMHEGLIPEGKADCENPIAKLAEFGRSHHITGTPTLMFENGSRVDGAISADNIERLLSMNSLKK